MELNLEISCSSKKKDNYKRVIWRYFYDYDFYERFLEIFQVQLQ